MFNMPCFRIVARCLGVNGFDAALTWLAGSFKRGCTDGGWMLGGH